MTALAILTALLAVAFYIPGQHLTRTHQPGAGDFYKAAAFFAVVAIGLLAWRFW